MTSRNPGHAAGAHWHRYPRRRTYAAAFRVHAAALFRRFHAAAMMPSLSRCHIYAASFTLQHALSHIYAAACTPQHASRSNAAALMPSLSRRGIGAAALILPAFIQHLACRRIFRSQHLAANLTLQRSAVAFTLPLAHRSIYTAALAGALCRWKRTTRSAFSNAEHDAGGREPARAGAGRGGAGRGRGWGGGF